MKRQAVLVDVSIDQGGCFETSRPTTHSDPTYEVDGVLHYCVANMPGAVPVTSTRALTNATMPYIVARRRRTASSGRAREPGAGQGRQRRRRQGDLRAGRRGDRASRTPSSSRRWPSRLYDAVIIGGGHNGLVAATMLGARRAVGAGARAARPCRWRRRVRAPVGGRRRAALALLLPRLADAAGAARAARAARSSCAGASVSSYSPRPDGTGLLVRAGRAASANWAAFEELTGADGARRCSRR